MHSNIAAFIIERRRISVAVFIDERLDFTGSRQLPSHYSKAHDSAVRYVDWIRRNFHIRGVALEEGRADPKQWKSQLRKEIISQFRGTGVPISEVDKKLLISSFAHPPLRYRTQLRKVISSIWPILATEDNHGSCLDAAALGLYVQVERIFAPKNQ